MGKTYCAMFNGIPLKIHMENSIITKIDFAKRCKSEDKTLSEKITAFWKGDRTAVEYFVEAKRDLKLIFRKVQEIPLGKVSSYGGVSRAIFGNTHYARLVGYAMRINPLPIIIPCHRVVKSNGEIGGFGGGIKTKIKLLKAEGVKVENGRIAPVYFADL